MCEIASAIRNTLKQLFEVEFWLALKWNTEKDQVLDPLNSIYRGNEILNQ